jgi:uncharacterized protein YutE (UPF0331/DUF86 family)
MVDLDLLAAKLADLAFRMQRVRSHTPDSAALLATDRDALDIVAFNLMLSVQLCADIASHIIADEGWGTARSLAEGFEHLASHGALEIETAEALKRAVGLRNVVAHGYSSVDPTLCFVAATAGLSDLSAFAKQVSSWARSQTK